MASPPPVRKRRCPDLGFATSTPVTAASPSMDIIFEILSWMPVKSVCRCRCVSKRWRALISGPAFLAAHRSRAESLLVTKIASERGRALQLMDTDGTVVRVVYLWWEGTSWACLDGVVGTTFGTLFDLATGETLLDCSKSAKEGWWRLSFGRTAQSGVYKAFRLGFAKDSHLMSFEVLNVGDGDGANWRQAQSPPAMLSYWYGFTSGVMVSGALHFLSWNEEDVLCFDLKTEEWKEIKGPPRVAGQRVIANNIAELNGALSMVEPMAGVTIIWLLVESNKSIWVKAYTMDMATSSVVPLRMLRLSGKLLFYYSHSCTSKPILQLYDPCLGICTDVKIPANVIGEIIGLCSSHFDPRLSGQP